MDKMNIKFKAYQIIERAVEDGIACGYKRAHKHTDNPSEQEIKECMFDYIMHELSEIINFDDEN